MKNEFIIAFNFWINCLPLNKWYKFPIKIMISSQISNKKMLQIYPLCCLVPFVSDTPLQSYPSNNSFFTIITVSLASISSFDRLISIDLNVIFSLFESRFLNAIMFRLSLIFIYLQNSSNSVGVFTSPKICI